jgi:hypothetical protein
MDKPKLYLWKLNLQLKKREEKMHSKVDFDGKGNLKENYENNPLYLEYVKLLRQYFEIKNDEEKLQSKFNEILTTHQKLVKSGIIVI